MASHATLPVRRWWTAWSHAREVIFLVRYDIFLVSKLQHGQGHTQDPGPDLQADQSLLQLVWDREGAQSAQDASRGTLGWSSELIMYAICLFVSI